MRMQVCTPTYMSRRLCVYVCVVSLIGYVRVRVYTPARIRMCVVNLLGCVRMHVCMPACMGMRVCAYARVYTCMCVL